MCGDAYRRYIGTQREVLVMCGSVCQCALGGTWLEGGWWCVEVHVCEQGQRYVEECMIVRREEGGMCEGVGIRLLLTMKGSLLKLNWMGATAP